MSRILPKTSDCRPERVSAGRSLLTRNIRNINQLRAYAPSRLPVTCRMRSSSSARAFGAGVGGAGAARFGGPERGAALVLALAGARLAGARLAAGRVVVWLA